MGAGLAQEISTELIARGMAPAAPVALVENASLPGRRLLLGTLAGLPDLARAAGDGPSALLFGEVLKDAAALPADAEALLKHA